MDFVKWGLNPWGQNILTHVSWTLFWASLFAGLMFLVAHGSYMLLSAHRKRPETETDRLEAAYAKLPARVERHSLMARLFHWVMAAAMFVLGYMTAVGLAVAGGALWDLTADARFAFLPIAAGALPLLILSPTIRLKA